MDTSFTLPDGREIDLDSPVGANEFLNYERFPFSQAINNTRKQCKKEIRREMKFQIGYLLHVFGVVFNHASKENILRVPTEEISCWVEFLGWTLHLRIKLIEDGAASEDYDICQDLNARILNAIQSSVRHSNCFKMMEKLDLLKAVADLIAVLYKVPNMPNDDIAETVCFIVVNIMASLKEKNGGKLTPNLAEKTYVKLEACGLLAQYIRCSTCPGTWMIEQGKQMKYRVYEDLQTCEYLIRRKFLGGPCRDVINDILAGKDGHRTYEDKRITQYLLNLQKIMDNIESHQEDIMCHNCNKRGFNFKICSQCKTAEYCSEECQKADWKKHKKFCMMINAKHVETAQRSGNVGGDSTKRTFDLKNLSDFREIRVPLNMNQGLKECFKI